MLVSMTGFGRSLAKAPFGRLVVEILSVNRKYLEVFVSMPKEFSRFEYEVRKWVGSKVSRGQITVRIYLALSSKAVSGTLPDIATLRGLKANWEKISEQLGVDPSWINVPFLLQTCPENVERSVVDEKDLPVLRRCVGAALTALLQMKKKEGKALATDIEGRLKTLEKMAISIEEFSPESAKKMRHKLSERMKGILAPGSETEERIYREIALFAEKVDISEELVRLQSHFDQFHSILKSKGAAVGRRMDFLVQEIGREINTIGSKSAEAKASHLVVAMKSELEKIREQIQNIE